MIRFSDPKPPYCSACFNADPEIRYVDFDAAYDAGSFADRETEVYISGSDDLHLCEACVRAAMEVLALKPEINANQLREIGRLQKRMEAWKSYAQDLEKTLKTRPDAPPSTREKVAA